MLTPHEIETSVLIVGGGPHALALLSALHEKSLAYPQFSSADPFGTNGTTAGLRKHLNFDSVEKVGTGETTRF